MKDKLGTIAGLGYFAMLIVQLVAIWDGIGSWWGVRGVLRVLAVLFIDAIPLLGQITGAVGAHDCWGWSWGGALLLFFWPAVLIGIASLLPKDAR